MALKVCITLHLHKWNYPLLQYGPIVFEWLLYCRDCIFHSCAIASTTQWSPILLLLYNTVGLVHSFELYCDQPIPFYARLHCNYIIQYGWSEILWLRYDYPILRFSIVWICCNTVRVLLSIWRLVSLVPRETRATMWIQSINCLDPTFWDDHTSTSLKSDNSTRPLFSTESNHQLMSPMRKQSVFQHLKFDQCRCSDSTAKWLHTRMIMANVVI